MIGFIDVLKAVLQYYFKPFMQKGVKWPSKLLKSCGVYSMFVCISMFGHFTTCMKGLIKFLVLIKSVSLIEKKKKIVTIFLNETAAATATFVTADQKSESLTCSKLTIKTLERRQLICLYVGFVILGLLMMRCQIYCFTVKITKILLNQQSSDSLVVMCF